MEIQTFANMDDVEKLKETVLFLEKYFSWKRPEKGP